MICHFPFEPIIITDNIKVKEAFALIIVIQQLIFILTIYQCNFHSGMSHSNSHHKGDY